MRATPPAPEIIVADKGDANSNRAFASMDRETRERIARKGGEASHRNEETRPAGTGGERGGASGSASGRSRGDLGGSAEGGSSSRGRSDRD